MQLAHPSSPNALRPSEARLGLDVSALALRFGETDSLEDRIRLMAHAVPGRIAFSTSLGIEDQAILHASAQSGAGIDVFTLDTGRLFAETIAASEQRYGVKVRVLAPDASDVEQLVARDGVLGFRTRAMCRASDHAPCLAISAVCA